jgi:hypothetical protein
MSRKSYLSRLNMSLFPERKYHMWLDLDGLTNTEPLTNLLNILSSLGACTITQRMKGDKFSFHVVYYETVFSIDYIQKLSKNLYLDNDIDKSVYSKDRLFREIYQVKFGEPNSE